jgi:hypothetical protein
MSVVNIIFKFNDCDTVEYYDIIKPKDSKLIWDFSIDSAWF